MMNDYKTTIAGILGAIATGVQSAYVNGGVPTPEAMITGAAIALVGYLAKDAKKNG